MLSDLVVNFCVVVALAFVAGVTLRLPSWPGRAARLLIAVAACALLARLAPASWLDLSLASPALAALLFGPLAALIVAALVVALQVAQGAAGVWPLAAGLGGVVAVSLPLWRWRTDVLDALSVDLLGAGVFRRTWWTPLALLVAGDLAASLVAGAPWNAPRAAALLGMQLAAVALGLWALYVLRRPGGEVPPSPPVAFTDELTGVFNRRQFDDDLAELSGDGPAFLLLLDLDHFKRVNDSRGHAFGDEVLARCARLLHEYVRLQDRIYRYGGEAFAVVLRGCTPEQAARVAERVRGAVEQRLGRLAGDPSLQLTVSAGLVELHPGQVKAELLEADTLLYAAKAAGRNRVMQAS